MKQLHLKQFLLGVALIAAGALAVSARAADVGVSVHIGDPGFYGRIDIGNYPPPPVIYRQPRVIVHEVVERQPVYMRVPPGHAKNWGKHCHKYNACDERVYFVQDSWYSNEYAPRYREEHRDRNDDRHDDHDGKHKHKKDKGHKDKGHGRDH